MRNYWTILDIKPTTDITKIKRAYSVKAKVVHPEENPEEFKELNEAYRSALRFAKNNAEIKDAVVVEEQFYIYRFSGKYDRKDDLEEKKEEIVDESISNIESSFNELIYNQNDGLDFSSLKSVRDFGKLHKDFVEYVNTNIKKKPVATTDEICNYIDALDVKALSTSNDFFNDFIELLTSKYINNLPLDVCRSLSKKALELKEYNESNRTKVLVIKNASTSINKMISMMLKIQIQKNYKNRNGSSGVGITVMAIFILLMIIASLRSSSEKPKYQYNNNFKIPEYNNEYISPSDDTTISLQIDFSGITQISTRSDVKKALENNLSYMDTSSMVTSYLTEEQFQRVKELYDQGITDVIEMYNDKVRYDLLSEKRLDYAVKIFTDNKSYTENTKVLNRYKIDMALFISFTNVYNDEGVEALRALLIEHVEVNIPTFDEILNSYK